MSEYKPEEKKQYNYWSEQAKQYKLSKKDREVIDKNMFDLTEEEKDKRRKIVSRIQLTNERKINRQKCIKKRKERVKQVEELLNRKDQGSTVQKPSILTKIKESRKLGLYLLNSGRHKQGLSYLKNCISYLEDMYEEGHPRLLSEYILYDKMRERVYNKKNKKE
jgi:hypothetical protein